MKYDVPYDPYDVVLVFRWSIHAGLTCAFFLLFMADRFILKDPLVPVTAFDDVLCFEIENEFIDRNE